MSTHQIQQSRHIYRPPQAYTPIRSTQAAPLHFNLVGLLKRAGAPLFGAGDVAGGADPIVLGGRFAKMFAFQFNYLITFQKKKGARNLASKGCRWIFVALRELRRACRGGGGGGGIEDLVGFVG